MQRFYKIKRNPDGYLNEYKTTLVSKGFTQRYGIDYEQTYNPLTKMGTVSSIFSIATNDRMHLTQLDVCLEFLFGTLHDAIYA